MSDGQDAYHRDEIREEAGGSLMMKIVKASKRLSRTGFVAPKGVDLANAVANRNWLIHQYNGIDRDLTWTTLVRDLPSWRVALGEEFATVEGGCPRLTDRLCIFEVEQRQECLTTFEWLMHRSRG